jgi:hypothetical protein
MCKSRHFNSYKYLGIWLDEHLTFDKSTKELANSASRALGAVYLFIEFHTTAKFIYVFS